jgi:hypothetical protein
MSTPRVMFILESEDQILDDNYNGRYDRDDTIAIIEESMPSAFRSEVPAVLASTNIPIFR